MTKTIELDRNTILFGKRNKDKTNKFLLPVINKYISKRESFLIIDTTEEYLESYYTKLINRKYNVIILNFKDNKYSIGWNPLLEPYKLYKNDNIKEAINQLQNFAKELFQDINPSQSYLKDEIEQYFIALSILLFRSADEDEINLNSVYALSVKGDKAIDQITYFEKIFNVMDVMDPVYMMGSDLIYSPKMLKDEMLTLFNQSLIKYIRYPDLSRLLSKSTFDSNDLINSPTALFINVRQNEASDNYLISSFIRYLFDNILMNNDHSLFHLIMDNFDFLPKISVLPTMLSLSNNYNYSIVFGILNSELVAKIYGDDYRKIITSVETVYNFDYDDTIMKVENDEKIALVKSDYEDFVVKRDEYHYPILELDNPKVFDLEKEIAERMNDKK